MLNDIHIVYHNGKPVFSINEQLLKVQGVEERLEDIKKLHVERLELFDIMKTTVDPSELKTLNNTFMEIEGDLQALWNFPPNKNYIRFWQVPQCSCPKMDNEEAYPTGYYIKHMDCLIHGNV